MPNIFDAVFAICSICVCHWPFLAESYAQMFVTWTQKLVDL